MATSAWGKLRGLSNLDQIGIVSSGFGAVSGAIGSYYASSAEKYRTKSLALALEHKKDMALFNMRMAESQAQHLNRAYNKQFQIATLKAGARKSTARATFAARGIQM